MFRAADFPESSKIEEAMVVAERASEMAYQLMQQNPL